MLAGSGLLSLLFVQMTDEINPTLRQPLRGRSVVFIAQPFCNQAKPFGTSSFTSRFHPSVTFTIVGFGEVVGC